MTVWTTLPWHLIFDNAPWHCVLPWHAWHCHSARPRSQPNLMSSPLCFLVLQLPLLQAPKPQKMEHIITLGQFPCRLPGIVGSHVARIGWGVWFAESFSYTLPCIAGMSILQSPVTWGGLYNIKLICMPNHALLTSKQGHVLHQGRSTFYTKAGALFTPRQGSVIPGA